MIRFPAAWLAVLAADGSTPRPDTAPGDPWRDLPPLDRDPLPFVIVGDPPPRDLRDRDDLPPLWTPPAPPNRAQRRAMRKRR